VKLTDEEIRKIALLARLGLSDEEVKKFGPQMTHILEYVEKLSEVKTDNVEPTAQVTGLTNVKRHDKVAKKGDPEYLCDPKELLECTTMPIERDQIKVKSVF